MNAHNIIHVGTWKTHFLVFQFFIETLAVKNMKVLTSKTAFAFVLLYLRVYGGFAWIFMICSPSEWLPVFGHRKFAFHLFSYMAHWVWGIDTVGVDVGIWLLTLEYNICEQKRKILCCRSHIPILTGITSCVYVYNSIYIVLLF